MRSTATCALILLATAFAAGCIPEQRFVTPDTGGVWQLAIDESTPAFFESEDGNVYLVEQRIEIDFRYPTDEEAAEMGDVGTNQVPWATLPFVRRDDIQLQVDYTISNVSDSTITAAVVLNGFNEFHEYSPGVQIIDEEVVAEFSGWERNIRLGPGERRTGTIREEELDEVAVDLSSVVNGAPNPNQLVYFENQSANDARSQLYIPDVVAGLTGVRIGLRSDAAVPVVLEVTLRVRDDRRILVQGDDEPWPLPVPALFEPSSVMAPAP